MIILGLENSKKLARKISQKLNMDYDDVDFRKFSDGEIHVKFKHNLKDKKVVIIQSLYPDINKSLFEVLFTASAVRDLGASKIIYVAPYLAYLREDSRNEKGECVSHNVVSDLLNRNVDEIVTVEPHLHQHNNIKKLFSIPFHRLDANELLRDYVKKNFSNFEVVGVGERAKVLAKHANFNSVVYDKNDKMHDFENHNVLVVDDIIRSGETMKRTLSSLKSNKTCLLTVHGLFVGDAYKNLLKNTHKIISFNTVEHESNQIDVSGLIAGKLMEL